MIEERSREFKSIGVTANTKKARAFLPSYVSPKGWLCTFKPGRLCIYIPQFRLQLVEIRRNGYLLSLYT